MTGRWHIRCQLPGGPEVVADFREPIASVLARAWPEPEPSDAEAIMSWYERNREQSEACRLGVCGDDHSI
jgi:hypothetical protein